MSGKQITCKLTFWQKCKAASLPLPDSLPRSTGEERVTSLDKCQNLLPVNPKQRWTMRFCLRVARERIENNVIFYFLVAEFKHLL